MKTTIATFLFLFLCSFNQPFAAPPVKFAVFKPATVMDPMTTLNTWNFCIISHSTDDTDLNQCRRYDLRSAGIPMPQLSGQNSDQIAQILSWVRASAIRLFRPAIKSLQPDICALVSASLDLDYFSQTVQIRIIGKQELSCETPPETPVRI